MFACSDGLKLPPAALQCHAVVVAVATLMQMSADPTAVSADGRARARDLVTGVRQAAPASATLC
jgi:hypothetical protein